MTTKKKRHKGNDLTIREKRRKIPTYLNNQKNDYEHLDKQRRGLRPILGSCDDFPVMGRKRVDVDGKKPASGSAWSDFW